SRARTAPTVGGRGGVSPWRLEGTVLPGRPGGSGCSHPRWLLSHAEFVEAAESQRRGRGELHCVTRGRGAAEGVAGPGYVRIESEPSSPGSTCVLKVVSSGGIPARSAAEHAGRGQL